MLEASSPHSGNLTFILEPQDQADAKKLLAHHGGDDNAFLADMLARFCPHGKFVPINPEEVGALTSAPMFATQVRALEQGARAVDGDVWWYPAYEHSNFAEVLVQQGKVTFMKGN